MTETTEQKIQLIAPTFKIDNNVFVIPELIGVKDRDEDAIQQQLQKVVTHTDLVYEEMIDIDPTDFKHVKGELDFTTDEENTIKVEVYMIAGDDFQSLYESYLSSQEEDAA